MRIIHTSDIHLDSPLTTRLSADKVRERKRELVDTFRRSVDKAIELGAIGYIISGDLFDSEKVTRSSLENLMVLIASVPQLTFFYLFGNHERRVIVDSGVDIPKNLKIFDDGWTYYKLDDVMIAGRCETERGMFDTLQLDREKRNIIVLHGELCDRSDSDGAIGVKEIAELPIDYIALGHYHTYSESRISGRCTAVYSGTPEGRGFDEVGRKGVVVIDADRYGVRHEFLPTAKRTLHEVCADISGARHGLDIENAVENATRGIPNTDIVRVLLTGERTLGESPETSTVEARFKDRFYYFEIKDETRVRICADDFRGDRSLKGEFIRSVIADDRLSDEEKDKVIATGLRALLGESID